MPLVLRSFTVSHGMYRCHTCFWPRWLLFPRTCRSSSERCSRRASVRALALRHHPPTAEMAGKAAAASLGDRCRALSWAFQKERRPSLALDVGPRPSVARWSETAVLRPLPLAESAAVAVVAAAGARRDRAKGWPFLLTHHRLRRTAALGASSTPSRRRDPWRGQR